MSQKNNIDDFKKAQIELLRIIEQFPSEKTDKVFYGNWTIKEVIIHILGWDNYFSDLLEAVMKNQMIEHWSNIDEFNQREVERRKDKNLPILTQKLKLSGNNFLKTYQDLKINQRSKKIWENRSYTPENILKIQIHHYRSQTKQIQKRLQ